MTVNDLHPDFDDPTVFEGDTYPLYARLQQEAPAYWFEPRRTWVLTRHADVKAVSANPGVFSSSHGLFWIDASSGRQESAGAVIGDDLIFLSDPPRHGDLRRVIAPAFAPRAVARLQEEATAAAARLLDGLERDTSIDFVAEFAKRFPTLLVIEVLGLDASDEVELRAGADALEAAIGYEDAEPVGDFDFLRSYLERVFVDKEQHPDDRLISTLATLGSGASLSRATLINLALNIIVGGNHTSRAMLSGFVSAMAERPDQYALLRSRRELVPSAIEETLRWVTPTRGHLRTALEATAIPSGQVIEAGQHVYLAYHAANRDSTVFDHPNQFDIERTTSKQHLAFGYGPHTCIAAPLIRMATAAFVPQLLDRVERIELAGPQVRVDTMLRSGWDSLPVRLVSASGV